MIFKLKMLLLYKLLQSSLSLILIIKTITFFDEFAKKVDLVNGSRWKLDINILFSKKINYLLECL